MPSTWREASSPRDGESILAPRTRKTFRGNTRGPRVDRPGKIALRLIHDRRAFTNTGECERFANQAKRASRFLRRTRRNSRRTHKNPWDLPSERTTRGCETSSDRMDEKREIEREREMRKSSTLFLRGSKIAKRRQRDRRFSIIYVIDARVDDLYIH